ncbi:MAG: CoA ester lyase [Anaerolineales bacterium]|nr:CoA ester lyase [Anaerolineales bacterium]
MRIRRSLLFVPGDSERKISKAAGLGADCVCLDLEDGVAVSQKPAARAAIRAALLAVDFGRSERLVRINGVGSGFEQADFDETIAGRPDGVVLAKVENAAAVEWLEARLIDAELAHGWPAGKIALLAMVETARGIVNLREIAAASRRLAALIFGAEDLAGDIGATRTRAGWEGFYARSAVVTYAAAFGLQAIDQVYVDYQDPEGLSQEARQGAELGYAGKQLIHPDQIAPVQAAFTPSAAAIAHAQRLITAFQAHQAAGQGAFALDGKMVDKPMLRAAEQVLAKARAAGQLAE